MHITAAIGGRRISNTGKKMDGLCQKGEFSQGVVITVTVTVTEVIILRPY